MCVLSDFMGENFKNFVILKDQFKICKFQKINIQKLVSCYCK